MSATKNKTVRINELEDDEKVFYTYSIDTDAICWEGYNPLDASAINNLFISLSGKSGRVYVRNNPGLATCDESIAKNRGWQIYHY
jgi:hypothetical protein